MDLRKVIGFPGYLMDVDDGTVWSFINGKHAVKIQERANGSKVVHLYCDGKHKTLMWYRLWYACRHNIAISRIPSDLFVRLIRPGNELALCTKQDLCQIMREKRNAQIAAKRDDIICRKLYELELMRRTYNTGDVSELTWYVETLREDAVHWFSVKYNVKEDVAQLAFDAAVDRMLGGLDNPYSLISEITAGLRGLMRQEKEKTKAVHLQEYLDVLRFPEQPVVKPKRSVKL